MGNVRYLWWNSGTTRGRQQSRKLWAGVARWFFFDGVGRNIDQDASEQRLSNVARLFRAYPDEDSNTDFVCHNKFYFSGMGTPYNEELISKLYTIMDQSLESMKEDLNDFAKETHEEISKEIRNRRGSWNETLKKIQDKLLDPKELRKKEMISLKTWLKNPLLSQRNGSATMKLLVLSS